jgi:hypothetical protein
LAAKTIMAAKFNRLQAARKATERTKVAVAFSTPENGGKGLR